MYIRWLATAVVQRPVLDTNSFNVSVPPPYSKFQPNLKKKKKHKSSETKFCTHKKYSLLNCICKKLFFKFASFFGQWPTLKSKTTPDIKQERVCLVQITSVSRNRVLSTRENLSIHSNYGKLSWLGLLGPYWWQN